MHARRWAFLILTFTVCLLFFGTADAGRRSAPDPQAVAFCISRLGFQDANYHWETMFKKGSDQWDIDVNHIYVERGHKHVQCMIRVGHGNSWKIYVCYTNIGFFEDLQGSLGMNMLWQGSSPGPVKANSVQHGGKNNFHYAIKPYFSFDKKMTPMHHAVVQFIKDTMAFYPEKIIWTENNKFRPLLPDYDYYKYGIPGNWEMNPKFYPK